MDTADKTGCLSRIKPWRASFGLLSDRPACLLGGRGTTRQAQAGGGRGPCEPRHQHPISDAIADNVPRGKVSEGRADIDAVEVYVNDVLYEEAVAVNGQDDGPGAFWHQHPYRGVFGPISVRIPLEEGTHIIRVETTRNEKFGGYLTELCGGRMLATRGASGRLLRRTVAARRGCG